MLTKNCDPPELGPALAMLSVPGSFEILCVCSSGIEPVPSRSDHAMRWARPSARASSTAGSCLRREWRAIESDGGARSPR